MREESGQLAFLLHTVWASPRGRKHQVGPKVGALSCGLAAWATFTSTLPTWHPKRLAAPLLARPSGTINQSSAALVITCGRLSVGTNYCFKHSPGPILCFPVKI